jgi:pimeloyl-ACP methyl ester carboxylesterase
MEKSDFSVGSFCAGLDGVTIQSKGSRLLGGLYRAAGQGPRPTAILLHGLPGVEKNLDIAYALRDAGWNCLYFHYRGSWGSEGAFSLAGRQDDLLAATKWLKEQPCVDADRLALIGHSAGGYLALMAGAMDTGFQAIVALCPLASPVRAPLSLETFNEFARMLHGVSGEELQSQWEALPALEAHADRLRGLSLLMLTGRQDEIFPPRHYAPLLAAVPTMEWHEFANGDHCLSLCRQEAVRRILAWLAAQVTQ